MSRENNFNIIRWIALFMVLYGHQFILLGQAPPSICGYPVQGLGVNILFVLSGYLIYGSYKKSRNLKEYLKKRIIRIFPPLVFVTIMTVFLCYFFTTADKAIYFKGSISYIIYNCLLNPRFGLPGVFEENYYSLIVNGSLWTLPIEFACYFIVPILYILCKKKQSKILLTAALFLGGCIVYFSVGLNGAKQFIVWGTDWIGTYRLVAYFLMGMGVAVWEAEKLFNLQIAMVLLVGLACARTELPSILMAFVVCYVVFSFAFAHNPRFVGFMGKLECSYGMYLWGFTIQQILINILHFKTGYTVTVYKMFLISSLASFAFAACTYYAVEKPVNICMNKKGKREK